MSVQDILGQAKNRSFHPSHGYVYVISRLPLVRVAPRAQFAQLTCRRFSRNSDRGYEEGVVHAGREEWVSGGQEEDEGRPCTRVPHSSSSARRLHRRCRQTVVPSCCDQEGKKRRTGRAARSCYARKASAQRSVHNSTAFVSTRGGGGKGKDNLGYLGDEEEEVEEA